VPEPFTAKNQLGCAIIPYIWSRGKVGSPDDESLRVLDTEGRSVETVALVEFVFEKESVSVTFTEKGLAEAIDAFSVFLQRLRDAKADIDAYFEGV